MNKINVFRKILSPISLVWLCVLMIFWKDITNVFLNIVVLVSLVVIMYILIVASSVEGKKTRIIFGREVINYADEFCTIGKTVIGCFLILLPYLNRLIIQLCSKRYGYNEGSEIHILFAVLIECIAYYIIIYRRSKAVMYIALCQAFSLLMVEWPIGIFDSSYIGFSIVIFYMMCLVFCNKIIREANLPRFLTRDIFVRGEKNIDD